MPEVQPAITGERLLSAWRDTLPRLIGPGDGHDIQLDPAVPNSLLIRIAVAGHARYSMDFRCTYVDDREVRVELLDIQEGNSHIDEREETVQSLIRDYVRHIRECASQLQPVTHA